jgi:geranylgeranyl reductase family protein
VIPPAVQSSASPDHAVDLDVAIVGAGPAGTAAALAFRGSGLRVAILEKAVPPRYKTCGGGVLRRASALLPLDISSVIERECHAAELVHHAPALRFVCRRQQPVISMVMRDRFDLLLTQAAMSAGAQLFDATAVREVKIGEDSVELFTSGKRFRARFVIAADGANSVVARQLGLPELQQVVPALECEVTLPPGENPALWETARFDFGFVPEGYAWVFPKREHLSIGVLTTRRGAANLPDYYRRYVEHLGVTRVVGEERHGYIIPCRPRRKLFSASRVLLVGDAAGLADPVTAEGITAGILSGQLAAQAILEGAGDAEKVRRVYHQTLNSNLLADLRVARALARILYGWPRVRGSLFSAHGQRVSELITQIVTGQTTYRAAVRRPANYLKLLRWRR